MTDAPAGFVPTAAALRAWRSLLPAAALVLTALAAAQGATYADMVRVWTESSTYNHCFLIPVISAWLAWEHRRALAALAPAPSPRGLAWLAVNALVWLAGDVLDTAALQHLAAVGSFIGVVWALAGDAVARLLRFPLVYLYFGVPEGEFLVPYLQDLTAAFSVQMLRLTGIPVFIEARYILIPSGTFVVAEACSGINYLIATLAVGTMFAYRAYYSWRRQLAFMALAVIVPLVANGLRAYGIILLAHVSNHKLAVGVDHIIYGWVFFGVVIMALFFIGGRFSDVGDTAPGAARRARAMPLPAAAGHTTSPSASLAIALAAAVLVAAGPALARLAEREPSAPARVGAPAARGDWHAPVESPELLGARYEGADERVSVSYSGPAGTVRLFMAYYRDPARDDEIASGVNRAFDEDRWREVQRGSAQAPLGDGLRVEQRILRAPDGHEFMVWSWYDLHGQPTNSRIVSKLAAARARLFGTDIGAAAFQAIAAVERTPADARQVLEQFVREVAPGLAGAAGERP